MGRLILENLSAVKIRSKRSEGESIKSIYHSCKYKKDIRTLRHGRHRHLISYTKNSRKYDEFPSSSIVSRCC
jgi:hypothetical protein